MSGESFTARAKIIPWNLHYSGFVDNVFVNMNIVSHGKTAHEAYSKVANLTPITFSLWIFTPLEVPPDNFRSG